MLLRLRHSTEFANTISRKNEQPFCQRAPNGIEARAR
jgi:hypothetical protein